MIDRSKTAITGVWKGEYAFDHPPYPEGLSPVGFELTLAASPDGSGYFNGSVVDGDDGMPGVGTVDGNVSGNQILFAKQMPIAYVMLPTGENVSFRE